MHFFEVEFKYFANDIKIDDLRAKMDKLNPVRSIVAGSYDTYLSNEERFMRFRFGENIKQLTSKIRTNDLNNNVRVELNIDLARELSLKEMTTFGGMHHLEYDFTIYKVAHVWFFPKHVVAHYITYDTNMNEKDRFVEIEADEGYAWSSEQEALNHIQQIESELGFSPQKRTKLSLFQRYTKNIRK